MTDLQTKVSAVVVYPDRARITRRGSVALEPGSHRLALTGLPASLDPASVRAMARGTAHARLVGVSTRREHHVETPVEKVRGLEKEIEALQDDVAVLDDRMQLLQEERNALRGLANRSEVYARGLAFGKIDASEQMALFEKVREQVKAINGELQEVAHERRDLERKLQKLQRDLNELRGARRRDRYAAFVELEVTQEGELTVDLTYVVSGASWTPLYDLRLMEDKEPSLLEVGYLAEVHQSTGEPWEDVQLTLSTARPALAQTVPELDTWYLSVVSTAPGQPILGYMERAAAPSAKVELTRRDQMRVREEDAEAEAEPVEVDATVAQVAQSGAAVTYKVPDTVSIPDGGEPRKVVVARISLQPKLDYTTAPKLVEAVYRHAVITNQSPYTLLPGKAHLFTGDEYIGRVALELTAPGGELELYLGVDDRVRVERTLTLREVDKKLLRDRIQRSYGYEIVVENLRKSEVQVTVRDQIPVPKNEALKVKLESAVPDPSEQTRLGILKWELTLPPGEKETLRFGFSVEHVRGWDVVGLP